MDLLIRIRSCPPALERRLAADPRFRRFFKADGPAAAAVLDMCAGERCTLFAAQKFTEQELDAASHLEVECRVTIGQHRAECERTLADYRTTRRRATSGRWRVLVPERVYLSARLRPDTIAHVDQYTGEYVAGSDAARSFAAQSFNGASLRPVVRVRGLVERDDAFQVFTERFLPELAADRTITFTYDDGPGRQPTPRKHGCFTYDKLPAPVQGDLFRTAEPFGPNGTPDWVVSQRVRQWFNAQRLRGWTFQPVLEQGTPLWREHSQRWGELLDRVAGRAQITI